MKRFFAIWVVSLVFAICSGLIVALIEYLTAETIESNDGFGTCLDTLLPGCPRANDLFSIYAFVPFLLVLVIYPIFRAVVGSFKLVFK